MNTYPFESQFGDKYNLSVSVRKHPNGQSRIDLIDSEDGSPYATATVSVPDQFFEEDEVFVKNYSENIGVLTFLVTNNIVHPPHRQIGSGYVNIPVCRLK
jgi:hypothetical protein